MGGAMSIKRNRGFSLLELLIVVAIILIIATIAMPSLLRSRQSAQESSAVAQIRTINTAEITYLSSNQGSFGDMPSLITQGLIDGRFSGSVSGYTYTVSASGQNYTVNADPTSSNSGRFVTSACRTPSFVSRRIRVGTALLAIPELCQERLYSKRELYRIEQRPGPFRLGAALMLKDKGVQEFLGFIFLVS